MMFLRGLAVVIATVGMVHCGGGQAVLDSGRDAPDVGDSLVEIDATGADAMPADIVTLDAAMGDGMAADAHSPADVPTVDAGDSPWPHEPAGFSRLTERSFDAVDEDGWIHGGTVDLAVASDAPRSPPGVQRQTYPGGSAGSDAPGTLERDITAAAVTEIYVSYWLRASDNWSGHDTEVNKLGFVWTAGGPRFFLNMAGSGSNPLHMEADTQDTPAGSRLMPANLGVDATMTRGVWHRLEFVLRMNTAGNSDGEYHGWLDGLEVANYTNVSYVAAGDSHRWEIVSWYPIWGGAGGTIPATQWIEIDHYYASGR